MPKASDGSASTAGYGAAADVLAEQYESIAFEDVHGLLLHLFPTVPARVLDIGAGTGRDAAALARRGHKVTAAEPTEELRVHGQRRHADVALRWIDDALPDLLRLRALGERFDLILLTAVWMHLDVAERTTAMPHLAGLMAPDGLVVMSLRHGPVPTGRRMSDVSAAETVALAEGSGLRLLEKASRCDMFGRGTVRWDVLALTNRS